MEKTRTAAILLLALTGCSQDGEKKVDPYMLLEGEAIYKAECATCHGPDLEGQARWREKNAAGRLPAPPLDASGPATQRSFQDLVAVTAAGLVPPHAPAGHASDHPAFAGKLSPRQIESVVHYLESRWPAEVRARQP